MFCTWYPDVYILKVLCWMCKRCMLLRQHVLFWVVLCIISNFWGHWYKAEIGTTVGHMWHQDNIYSVNWRSLEHLVYRNGSQCSWDDSIESSCCKEHWGSLPPTPPPTSSSLIATQLLRGNPCSMGTRNCRHPDQWPTSSIMQIRLNIRMNTDAMFRNWNGIYISRLTGTDLQFIYGDPTIFGKALKHGHQKLETPGPVTDQEHHTNQVEYPHKHPNWIQQLKK